MLAGSTPAVQPARALLYLHGFNSSSASPKARLVKAACGALARHEERRLACLTPDLSHRPDLALQQAEAALEVLGCEDTLLVGSSMGGFLATLLAERYGLRAVLINPAVQPARFVGDYLGQTLVNDASGECFTIDNSYFDQLTALQWERIVHPTRYLLLLGSDDETLDCRDALRAYAGSRTLIHPGGDHGFDVLHEYLPALFAHGGWRVPTSFSVS
ncbi:alpha/beta fold hydrolase [Salinicola corii]|uniref:Alpha/beta fold hydrolase n=1 Tax=Salinicola corii TaxID=2606937 RepID=A0A640W762_9GAMM|nr:YqiA/YcfP family alpha/beta fold hydrolase [Salinicola corii]KAA0015366.1 alpha/beta fold hydrolase [Salinicola corii]